MYIHYKYLTDNDAIHYLIWIIIKPRNIYELSIYKLYEILNSELIGKHNEFL